jgi:hypothetical protein
MLLAVYVLIIASLADVVNRYLPVKLSTGLWISLSYPHAVLNALQQAISVAGTLAYPSPRSALVDGFSTQGEAL